jgi:phenylacetate-coenzyme A ligase PaaK-like adenylate-forming protein
MHLADDVVIVETVDSNGRPVPPGVLSDKVFVTNLVNAVQPLIRYEITDQVVMLDEPCACGSGHRRVADIQGRLDDEFTYTGAIQVHPHVFRSALVCQPAVTEYQVHQTTRGAEILLCHDTPIDSEALTRNLAEALRKLGLADARVTARTVDCIPRLDSGKLKRFIPLK